MDATNVVSTSLSIICSVCKLTVNNFELSKESANAVLTALALDHTRVLGSTVEEIGHKKAGIFKKGVPAIVGPGVPLMVMQVISIFVNKMKCIIKVHFSFSHFDGGSAFIPFTVNVCVTSISGCLG